jgi:hypothetical protein
MRMHTHPIISPIPSSRKISKRKQFNHGDPKFMFEIFQLGFGGVESSFGGERSCIRLLAILCERGVIHEGRREEE